MLFKVENNRILYFRDPMLFEAVSLPTNSDLDRCPSEFSSVSLGGICWTENEIDLE